MRTSRDSAGIVNRSPAAVTLALERSAVFLADRLRSLEARVEGGDERVWREYCETVRTLAAVLPNLMPERRGALLTTAEMAARLNVAPKTLLKHKAQGRVRPALQRGKLIRWQGNETLRA